MTLAMTALFADAPTTLTNIGSWRVKETDRIAAMATELAQAGRGGGPMATTGCGWRLRPSAKPPVDVIDTYDDHRMAMCFALATLKGVPVTIDDPGCVRKTYPGYFDAFVSGSSDDDRRSARDCRGRPGRLRQGNRRGGRRPRAWFPLPRQRLAVPPGRAAGVADRHAAATTSRQLARLAAGLDVARFDDGDDRAGRPDATDAIRPGGRSRPRRRGSRSIRAVRAGADRTPEAFRRPPGLVADGRDMGTVVFPDALDEGVL